MVESGCFGSGIETSGHLEEDRFDADDVEQHLFSTNLRDLFALENVLHDQRDTITDTITKDHQFFLFFFLEGKGKNTNLTKDSQKKRKWVRDSQELRRETELRMWKEIWLTYSL